MQYFLERESLKRADFWCSKSVYTAQKTGQYLKLDRQSDSVLYNPVHIASESTTQRRPDRVVFTGTLTEKKGVVSLIDAWPSVVAARPQAELHLFGKDQQRSDGVLVSEELRERLPVDIRRSVAFHGHVGHDRILNELQAAAVGVFPSFSEGFANAPLEAMACGCPTIYSTRGSGPELIDDSITGIGY